MAFDKALCSDVITAFVRAPYRHLRAKAKRELGLGSVSQAHPGSITFLSTLAAIVGPASAATVARALLENGL